MTARSFWGRGFRVSGIGFNDGSKVLGERVLGFCVWVSMMVRRFWGNGF